MLTTCGIYIPYRVKRLPFIRLLSTTYRTTNLICPFTTFCNCCKHADAAAAGAVDPAAGGSKFWTYLSALAYSLTARRQLAKVARLRHAAAAATNRSRL